MIYPGGYQMIDCAGIEITNDSATPVSNKKIADILRSTNKPVYFYNITVDGISTNVVADIRTNTGAYDGKVYGFIGPNSTFFNVSTDDHRVMFTPG